MKIESKLIKTVIMSCILIFAGCSKDDKNTSLNNIVVEVEIEKARIIDGSEDIAFSGTIVESETIPLSFSVPGSVLSVKVSEGDYVKKGQLLAELNSASYMNASEMSLAALAQAEDAYKRLEPMYRNGNLPEIKFVEVETGLQQAKAAAAISKKNLDDCRLYSPVNGMIGRRSIEPGMNVLPGITAISIVKIEKVFARVPVSENEISSINKGQSAIIKIGALGNDKYKGQVEEIGVLADPLAHTYKIKIGIQNKDRIIKPGMICSVSIKKTGKSEQIILSNQAVRIDEKGKTFIYCVDKQNNKAVRRFVTTGRLLKNGVEITNGLRENELVVIAGQQKLVNNSLVSVSNIQLQGSSNDEK